MLVKGATAVGAGRSDLDFRIYQNMLILSIYDFKQLNIVYLIMCSGFEMKCMKTISLVKISIIFHDFIHNT